MVHRKHKSSIETLPKPFAFHTSVTSLSSICLVSPRLSVGGESYVLRFSFCLSVCLSSREFTFRPSNVNITCSTATSLSPLMEKSLSIVFLYLESHTRYRKSRKLEKPFFGPTSLKLHFRRSVKGLKICQHKSLKCMCRLLFLLLILEL